MMVMVQFKDNPPEKDYGEFTSIVNPIIQKKGFRLISNNPKIYYNEKGTEIMTMDIVKHMKAQVHYSSVVKSIHIGKLRKV